MKSAVRSIVELAKMKKPKMWNINLNNAHKEEAVVQRDRDHLLRHGFHTRDRPEQKPFLGKMT